MADVMMEIPDEVLARLRQTGQEPAEVLQLAAAFNLCRRGVLAMSLAARIQFVLY
jgi:hypothetical protein